MLVNQKTKWPVRKLIAAAIAGAITGAILNVMVFIPGAEVFTPFVEQSDQWIQALVMLATGYMVKERA